jgi:hypothetical protein
MADNAKPVLLSTTKQPRFVDPNAPLAKQQEMFLALMRDPPENSRVITIVPALADWLIATFNVEGSGGNRKKKPKRIERYSDSMKGGTWLLTGEPLIFGKQKLLDGQNRLMGCVRSGKKFRTHVVFGVDDNVFAVINSGKSRTNSDTFFTAGVEDHSIVSPAVRWLMMYAEDDPMARSSYSNQQVWEFYNDPARLDKALLKKAVERSKKVSRVLPRFAMAAHFYLFSKKSEKTAAKMAADFDKNQHGARKLTAYIAKIKKKQQGRLNDVWVNALIIGAWNAYRANRTVTMKDLTFKPETMDYPKIT